MKTSNLKSAELVQDKKKRMYHIGLSPKDIHPFILLCGDVNRPAKVAERFSKIRYRGESREFRTISGTYKGIPVTAMSSGIGPSAIEIVLTEIAQIIKNPVIIRIGTCGAFQKEILNGDLVISAAAYRLEDTSLKMVDPGYPANAHHRIVSALEQAAIKRRVRYHVGITATSSGFFAGQGRSVGGFVPADKDFVGRLNRLNVKNCEMESSTIFTMATIKGWKSGTVCAVVANRIRNQFISPAEYPKAEARAIDVALESLVYL